MDWTMLEKGMRLLNSLADCGLGLNKLGLRQEQTEMWRLMSPQPRVLTLLVSLASLEDAYLPRRLRELKW